MQSGKDNPSLLSAEHPARGFRGFVGRRAPGRKAVPRQPRARGRAATGCLRVDHNDPPVLPGLGPASSALNDGLAKEMELRRASGDTVHIDLALLVRTTVIELHIENLLVLTKRKAREAEHEPGGVAIACGFQKERTTSPGKVGDTDFQGRSGSNARQDLS